MNTHKSLTKQSRAASLLGYALLVGLVSVVALSAITSTGDNTESMFSAVSVRLGSVNQNSGAGGGGTASSPTPVPSPTPFFVQLSGGARNWSDGLIEPNCDGYRDPDSGYDYTGDTGTGAYRIDPDGGDPSNAFVTLCNMDIDSDGWTLAMTAQINALSAAGGLNPETADCTSTTSLCNIGPKLGAASDYTIFRTTFDGCAGYGEMTVSTFLTNTLSGGRAKCLATADEIDYETSVQPGTFNSSSYKGLQFWGDCGLSSGGQTSFFIAAEGFSQHFAVDTSGLSTSNGISGILKYRCTANGGTNGNWRQLWVK
ncbi:MAG: hypothetical protein Alpg2KO_28410 [Alphaproteobacteria bacterium]